MVEKLSRREVVAGVARVVPAAVPQAVGGGDETSVAALIAGEVKPVVLEKANAFGFTWTSMRSARLAV